MLASNKLINVTGDGWWWVGGRLAWRLGEEKPLRGMQSKLGEEKPLRRVQRKLGEEKTKLGEERIHMQKKM